MQKQTLRQHWIALTDMRVWVRNTLCDENDAQTREALFKTDQAIGFAMLHLEEVEFRTNGAYSGKAS